MYRLVFKDQCKCALQRSMQQQQNRRQFNNNSNQNNNNNGHGLPPPPHMREAGFGKVMLIVTPLAAVGGVITYAKYDIDFRKKIEKNVPGAGSIIKVALREEPPFQNITSQINKQIDSVKQQVDSISKSIDGVTSTVSGFFGSDKSEPAKVEEPKPKPSPKIQKAQVTTSKTENVGASKPTPAESKSSPAISKPTKPVIEALPTDIIELERSVEISANLAVQEYNKAIGVLKSFNEDVRKVVDEAVENVDTSLWTTLKNKTSARDTSVSTAEKQARDAIDKIERCEKALSKVVSASNQEQVETVRGKIKRFIDHINNVKDELYRHKDVATVSEKYWRNVEKARNYFIDEIESIFPGLNLSEKQLNLGKDDLDLFIMHAYSHVLSYQKELQRIQTDGELRLKRAIDALRGDSDSEAMKAQLEYYLEAEKRKLSVENQKKIFHIRADADKQLRMQLKKQAEAHVDHLKDVISLKENELKRNYTRELEEKLGNEKANYKLQLAAMLGKLRGMDAALQARAESERSANQAQALWAACQALWSTVRTATPGVHYKEKLRPLKNEILAITKVAEGDELVNTVLKNMPAEARDRGVFPEDALRERFLTVERIARKVALVPEEGASIPMYFLSYLQSLFIMRPENPISQDELENKPFDYSKLDTYDILNRARYYVDRSDFLQALKYMNLLQGAPRKIANDWLKETRLMLETQQAANTLMAHAAVSGLLYL